MATKKQAAPLETQGTQSVNMPAFWEDVGYFRAKVGGTVSKFDQVVDVRTMRAQAHDYEEVTEAEHAAYLADHAARLAAAQGE